MKEEGNILVKLGTRASIFYDPVSKIKICKGETQELTPELQAKTQIRNALHNGYLVKIDPVEVEPIEEEVNQEEEPDVNSLKDKFLGAKSENKTHKQIKELFTMNELKALAISLDIEPESEDTKLDLIKAIEEDLSTEQGK